MADAKTTDFDFPVKIRNVTHRAWYLDDMTRTACRLLVLRRLPILRFTFVDCLACVAATEER